MCLAMAGVCVFSIYHYMQLSLHKPIPPIVPIYHTTNSHLLSLMSFFYGHSRYRCNFGPEDKSSIVLHDMQALLKSTQKKNKQRMFISCFNSRFFFAMFKFCLVYHFQLSLSFSLLPSNYIDSRI